jgi:hypothetical protein
MKNKKQRWDALPLGVKLITLFLMAGIIMFGFTIGYEFAALVLKWVIR